MMFPFELLIFVVFMIFIILFMTWPVSIPLIIYYLIKRSNNRKQFKNSVIRNIDYFKEIKNGKYTDIKADRLSGFDIHDLDKLKAFLYDIFVNFENAYNSLDYNTMYNLSTKKLYNMYYTNVECSIKLDEKRIIKDIDVDRMIIYDAYSSEYRQVVFAMIEISYINYVQKTNGKIISGNPNEKIKESFEVNFVKYFKDIDLFKCPNCGASIKGTTCDYCKSKVNNCEFKIDSIQKIERIERKK